MAIQEVCVYTERGVGGNTSVGKRGGERYSSEVLAS
jgi:hypothetical protein